MKLVLVFLEIKFSKIVMLSTVVNNLLTWSLF